MLKWKLQFKIFCNIEQGILNSTKCSPSVSFPLLQNLIWSKLSPLLVNVPHFVLLSSHLNNYFYSREMLDEAGLSLNCKTLWLIVLKLKLQSNVFCNIDQGILTEGEVSVRLTSLYSLDQLRSASFHIFLYNNLC